MEKEKKQTVPEVIYGFAKLLGTEIKNRRLKIPEKFGKGYCAGFVFNEHIRMIVSNYELYEDLMVESQEINASKKMIFFKFQNIFSKTEPHLSEKPLKAIPAVLIGTSRINTDGVISIHTNTATINIEVDANYLNELFDVPETSLVLKSLIQNTQPLLFEQIISTSNKQMDFIIIK